MKTALTIAGSDSGGGAGIQVDLKTFTAHGVFGTSAVTAITAQNTLGVTAWQAVPADLVTAQIEAVFGDIGVDGVKTGMLANAAIVEAVAAAIESLDLPRVVVDPVMIAKGGARLLDDEAVGTMCAELIPRAYLVTPNAEEAAALAGVPVRTLNDAREAAKRIAALGPGAVIVKGGHLDSADAIDIFYDGRDLIELRAERIDTRHTHGTGCTFSSAITANLALGLPLAESVARAKTYLTEAIRQAPGLGRGRGPLGLPGR